MLRWNAEKKRLVRTGTKMPFMPENIEVMHTERLFLF